MKRLIDERYEITIVGKDWSGTDCEMVETLKNLEDTPRFGDFSIITDITLECVTHGYAIFDKQKNVVCTLDVNYYMGSIYDTALERLNKFNLINC